MNQNQQVANVFNIHASRYAERYMDFDLYHDTFDFLIRHIPSDKSSLLDVGCGPGNIAAYFKQRLPKLSITGIDIASEMLAIAKQKIPTGDFLCLDCRDVATLAQKFDVIILGFCLPYLDATDSQHLIEDAIEMLHPNGLLYISTMENDYAASAYRQSSTGEGEPLFTHYYKEKDIVPIVQNLNMDILNIQRKAYDTQTTDIIIIAKKL